MEHNCIEENHTNIPLHSSEPNTLQLHAKGKTSQPNESRIAIYSLMKRTYAEV